MEVLDIAVELRKNKIVTKPLLGVFGENSTGKSRFLNSLIEKKIFDTEIGDTTKVFTLLTSNLEEFKKNKSFQVLSSKEYKPLEESNNQILEYLNIIDLPGVGKGDIKREKDIQDIVREVDFIVFVVDASAGPKKSSVDILKTIINNLSNKDIFLVLNKIDAILDEDLDEHEQCKQLEVFNKYSSELKNEGINLIFSLPYCSKNKSNEFFSKEIEKFRHMVLENLKGLSYIANINNYINNAVNNGNNQYSSIINSNFFNNAGNELSQYFLNYIEIHLPETLNNLTDDYIVDNKEKLVESVFDNLQKDALSNMYPYLESIKKNVIDYYEKPFSDIQSIAKVINKNIYTITNQKNDTKFTADINISGIESNALGIGILAGTGGLIAELALGSLLIPGIGILIGVAGILYAIFTSKSSKAKKIRNKITEEFQNKKSVIQSQVSEKLSILIKEINENIYRNFIKNINDIKHETSINKDKLINKAQLDIDETTVAFFTQFYELKKAEDDNRNNKIRETEKISIFNRIKNFFKRKIKK